MRAAIEKARSQPGRDLERDPPVVVVSSHENLIRALTQQLDGLGDHEVPLVDIPYATPLVYHFDETLQPIPTKWAVEPLVSGWYMGDPKRVKDVQLEIQSGLGCNPHTDELCHLEYAKGYAEGSAQSGWSGEADAEPEQGCIRIDKDGKSVWQCD